MSTTSLNFADIDLQESIKQTISNIGFTSATEIQSKTIPFILQGTDILASSKTGSGKTGAFAIPMISLIIKDNISCLILVPTRELATQVEKTIRDFRGESRIMTASLLGGVDIRRQISVLQKKPNVIIATPGRLFDHISRKTVNLETFGMLILDEFDRMLDMGFKDEIKKIISFLPKSRQTLMFSATTRKSVKDLAKEYLNKDFKEVLLKNTEEENKNITEDFIEVSRNDKYDKLTSILDKQEGAIIIFTATKSMADQLADKLQDDKYEAEQIHGDLRQRQREHVIKNFRNKNFRILIATDVVARGLDIPHVELVINFDMPNNPEDYTHRIGRTGRAGKKGLSISFVTSSDSKIHRAITSKQNSDEFESKFSRPKRDFQKRSFGGGSRSFGFKSSTGRYQGEGRGRESSFKSARFSGNSFSDNNKSRFKKTRFENEFRSNYNEGGHNDRYSNFKSKRFNDDKPGFNKSRGFKKR